MKKLPPIILVILFFVQSFCFAWEWEPYGPPDVKVNKVCFFNFGLTGPVICVDSGMYTITENFGDFEFYSYSNMAVVEAVTTVFDPDSIFLVMSDGSWSDGIYAFNIISKQFNNLHFCYHPNFIIYDDIDSLFYVGFEYGLLISDDGSNWMTVSFFDGKSCIDMEILGDYLVVATTEENNNTFLSDDKGLTWTELEGENITELAGNQWYNSSFYGISEGESYNCGLYQLDISSLEWTNEFNSNHLSAIGTNSVGVLYVGWHSGVSPYEGVANCFPELEFLNDGLPDLNINAISSPIIFGATVIYCCTDSGVFSRVLSVGVPENSLNQDISVFPNPVSNQATIKINLIEPANKEISIFILNNQGQKVDEIRTNGDNSKDININWNKGDLVSGLYFLKIKSGIKQTTKKFIIL